MTDLHQNGLDEAFLNKCRPRLVELETVRLAKLKVFQFRKKLAFPVGAILTPLLGFIDYWLILLQRGNDEACLLYTSPSPRDRG